MPGLLRSYLKPQSIQIKHIMCSPKSTLPRSWPTSVVLRLTAVRHAEGLLEQIATSHPRGLTGESWSEPEICAPSRHPGLCRPRTTPENYCLIHHQVSQERSFRFTPEQVTGSQVPVDCDPGKYALSPFSTLLSISPSPQTLASFALTDLCLIKPHMG